MKHHVLVFALFLIAVPAFGQDTEEALRELGMGGVFATGNLPVREINQANDPVQQLKRFFNEAKMPLSSDQQKKLDTIVEAARNALATPAVDANRMTAEFMRRMNGVLTPEQQNTWRRFRTEQIMLRGGFPALSLVMENAKTPFTPEQETGIRAIYADFNQQISKTTPDRAGLDKLESEALVKVVKMLTPDQRRALLTSRSSAGKAKPPQ